MELTLSAPPRNATPPPSAAPAPRAQRPRRATVSRWWFARMREAVEGARDWPPTELDWAAEQGVLPLPSLPTRYVDRRVSVV